MIQHNSTAAAPQPAEQTIPALGAGLDFSDPNSPLAPYYMRNGHLTLVALLGLLFLLLSYVPLWHTDIWGHLKFGEWTVQHAQLPDNGLSDFAEPSAPGIHAYWLCQSGLYLAYQAGAMLAGSDHRMEGGVQALRTLHIMMLAARFIILLLAMRRLSKSLGLASIGLFCVLLLGSGHIGVFRPQTFAELFFACVLFALSRDVLSRRAVVMLPLLLALWANTHGSYLLGLVLLGGWLVGRAVSVCIAIPGVKPAWVSHQLDVSTWARRLGISPRPSVEVDKPISPNLNHQNALAWVFTDVQLQRLGLALVLAIAAVALLNPHGPVIFLNTYRMGNNPNVALMDEWLPLYSGKVGPGAWLIFLSSLVLLIATQAFSKKFFSPAQLILIVLFAAQSIFHQRMLIWWLMLAPWLAVPLWPSIVERLRQWRAGGAADTATPQAANGSFRKTMLAGLLGVVIFLWSAPGQWLVTATPAPLDRSLSKGTPWQLAEQLHKPDDPAAAYLPALNESLIAYGPGKRFRGRIFASETLGDYLLWYLPAETPPVVYTHVHLFSPEHWRKCLIVKYGVAGWDKVLEEFGVNLIVVEADLHPFLRNAVLQDANWEVVLNESSNAAKPDLRTRFFVAVRKKPI